MVGSSPAPLQWLYIAWNKQVRMRNLCTVVELILSKLEGYGGVVWVPGALKQTETSSPRKRPERWGCGIVICAQFCLCKSSDPAAESSQCVAGSTWRSRWRTGLTRTSLRPTKVNKPCMWDRITQLQHRLWVSWLEGTCSSWCTLNWIQVSSMLLQPRNPVTYTNHKVEKQLFPSPEQVWE